MIFVRRKREDATGEAVVKYRTRDGTARAGIEFQGAAGELHFGRGIEEQSICLEIFEGAQGSVDQEFYIDLVSDPEAGGLDVADFGGHHRSSPGVGEAGSELTSASVSITDREPAAGENLRSFTFFQRREHASKSSNVRFDIFQSSTASAGAFRRRLGADYVQQFRDAVRIEVEEDETPTAYDWAVHFVTVFWKVCFAFVPPVWVAGGWARFFTSLGAIGILTGAIADVASLLGCVAGIPDSITAITLVAAGTSLPDTLASKSAAVQDPTADASVGNVMGSNSVNVFLGIGLSWSMAAIYWAAKQGDEASLRDWALKYPDAALKYPSGGKFVVKSGSLDVSVAIFISCSVVCIATLLVRRYKAEGELGGPVRWKYLTAGLFVCLWLVYISLSVFHALSNRGPCD